MANNSRPSDGRVVPVPELCRSLHAVFSTTRVDGHDVEVPPAVLLRHFGATEAELQALSERPHAHLISTQAPTPVAGATLLEARRDAFALSDEIDGIVVDLGVPRVVRPTAIDLAVASQWVALDLDGTTVRSRGLDAFGLPELRIDDVPAEHTAMVLAIAIGLAHRLITEWPTHDPVGPAAVTLRDIAVAYDDPGAPETPVEPALDLMVDLDPHGSLSVTLLDDPQTLFR